MNEAWIVILSGVVAGSCPVLFAALGETLSEKSGVINLSLDGCILLCAFTAFVASYHTGSVMAGFAAAALTGSLVSLVLGLISIFLSVSQVALGFVLSLLCRDLAYFFGNSYSRVQGVEVAHWPVPWLSSIPVIGPSFFQHNMVVYLSMVCIVLLWFYSERTGAGLSMKAAGENPHASFARGGRPRLVRLYHVVAGGALAGIAGASFSLFFKAGWGRPQGCEGTGWIALALVIFGGWSFFRVALGCYLFSLLQIVGVFMQQHFVDVPAQVFQVAPFPLMIFSLALIHVYGRVSQRVIMEPHGPFRFLSAFFTKVTHPAPAHLGKHFEP